jgi:calcineurin-like phosphoesterase family protein
MHKNYFISDPHFGHHNILTFEDNEGKLCRPFSSIEEHDNLIIDNINKVVRDMDKLYILGDVVMNRRMMPILDRIITKKRILVRGNHDIFKLKDYLPYFKDIRAYKVMPKHNIIFSHIPIHPVQFEGRWEMNIHGHMHSNFIHHHMWCGSPDLRYFNICPEQVGYAPLELEEILERKPK